MSTPTPIHDGQKISPAAATVRKTLLEGLAPVPVFAEASEKTPRTVFSWIPQGLPVVYIGRTPYVVIEPARDWLRSRRYRPRPRSAAKQNAAA